MPTTFGKIAGGHRCLSSVSNGRRYSGCNQQYVNQYVAKLAEKELNGPRLVAGFSLFKPYCVSRRFDSCGFKP